MSRIFRLAQCYRDPEFETSGAQECRKEPPAKPKKTSAFSSPSDSKAPPQIRSATLNDRRQPEEINGQARKTYRNKAHNIPRPGKTPHDVRQAYQRPQHYLSTSRNQPAARDHRTKGSQKRWSRPTPPTAPNGRSMRPRPANQTKGPPRQPTCFACGEPGHKIQRCDEVERRERRGEIERRGWRLRLPNGRILRKQNGEPLLAQLSHMDRSGEEEQGDLTSVDRDATVVAEYVSNEDKNATHRESRLPHITPEPSPPDPRIYRSIATSPTPPAPPPSPASSVVAYDMSASVSRPAPPYPEGDLFRVVFRFMLSPAQAACLPLGLAYHCAMYFVSQAYRTVADAVADMFSYSIFRVTQPDLGELLLLPGPVSFNVRNNEYQVARHLRAIFGRRSSSSFVLWSPLRDALRCALTAVLTCDRLIVACADQYLPPGLHPNGWTFVESVGPREPPALTNAPSDEPTSFRTRNDPDDDDDPKGMASQLRRGGEEN
ncbi:hypothetical protein BC629DRAFT_1592680 [Irpex lacteus]|nr:hypothetical protein BC629DRAFT_1592680 [Irpex lacteus]